MGVYSWASYLRPDMAFGLLTERRIKMKKQQRQPKVQQLESIYERKFQELPAEKLELIFGGLVAASEVFWHTTEHGGDTGHDWD